MIVGALLYLGGSFLVTICFNVPRNNILARVDPVAPGSELVWQEYLSGWTAWNHVRTVASLAAAVSFMLQMFSS